VAAPIPFHNSLASAPEAARAAFPAVCPVPPVAQQTQRRGVRWVAGSFLFCPCHLPITLTVLAGLLGGTTLGAALHHYPWSRPGASRPCGPPGRGGACASSAPRGPVRPASRRHGRTVQ